MRSIYLSILFILLFPSAPLRGTSTASEYVREPSSLPGDIVFSASNGEVDESFGSYRYNILGLIESETLEVSQFYVDEAASLLKPLSWSPDGSLLAILWVARIDKHEAIADMCVLRRSGELQICFDDKPSSLQSSIPSLDDIEQQYLVTWSPDSTRLYFVAEDITGDQGTRRLIEADVSTGRTLDAIYQVQFTISSYNPIMIWTPSLDQIALRVQNYTGIGQTKVMDIKTGYEWSPDDIASDQEIDMCGAFSPSGDYLIATIYNIDRVAKTFVNAFAVIDKQGTVVHIVDVSAYTITSFQCPAWSADERYLLMYLFDVYKVEARILSYSLQDETLTERAFWFLDDTHMAIPDAVSPLQLFPTSAHIAFGSGGYFESITVIPPNGDMLNLVFDPPFSRARWPLWVPKSKSK